MMTPDWGANNEQGFRSNYDADWSEALKTETMGNSKWRKYTVATEDFSEN